MGNVSESVVEGMRICCKVPSIPRQLLFAVVLAIVGAVLFGPQPSFDYIFQQVGNIFLDLLKMIVVPIAFFSITSSIINLGTERLRHLSARFLLLMVGMSLVGFLMGFIFMSAVPIAPFSVSHIAVDVKSVSAPTVLEFIRGCIPVNPFQSLASGNMLQIITLSFFIGLAAKQSSIASGFSATQSICIQVANLVMYTAPFGVFCLLYPVVAKNLAGIVLAYLQMTLVLIAGVIIYMLLICLPLLYFCRQAPIRYFRTIILQDIVGAIAGGSMTYLAPRIANLKKNTNLNHDVIDFFVPLTAVLTRMGSTICVGIYTVFAANLFHVLLSGEQIVICAFLTIIALMCAPGIIGGTLMDCAIIWAAIGIPIEAIAYIAGIDYIMDVLRTILNIQGGEIITACMDCLSTTNIFEKRKDVQYEQDL